MKREVSSRQSSLLTGRLPLLGFALPGTARCLYDAILFSWAFLCIGLSVAAQNLIPNSSFEEHVRCPGVPDILDYPIELAIPWTTPTFSTDYFNACGSEWSSVPNNRVGYEHARTGQAYAGFMLFAGSALSNPDLAVREYLQVPLTTELKRDSIYLLSVHVSIADSMTTITTDAFEALFTNTKVNISPHPVYSLTPFAFYTTPDLVNRPGNFLTIQQGWMPLKWVYRARGGEAWLTMGIFRRNAEVTIIPFNPRGFYGTYVYVDDVSLVPAPAQAADLMIAGDLVICDSVGVFALSALSPEHSNFLWSTGDTARSITVTRPGTYTVWAEYEDGYMLYDSITVAYRPAPALNLGPDTSRCPGDFPLLLSAPEGMDAYWWSTADSTSTISISMPGAYSVQASHHCGEQRDTIFIGMYDVPLADLGQDTVICGETPIAIPLSAPLDIYAHYTWSNGSTANAIVADMPGLWWMRMVHPCGVYADSMKITQQPLLSFTLPPDTTYCLENGLYIELPSGFDTYHWSTGQTSASILIEEPGTYTATARYACGTASDTMVVHAAPMLALHLPQQAEVYLGDAVRLAPGLDGRTLRRAQWLPEVGVDCPSCPAVWIQPPFSKVYTLEVEDIYGCRDSQQIQLVVIERSRIFAPNAFSPNGDGINDRFTLYAGPEVRLIRWLQVFDRWGGMVFERRDFLPNDESAGWDGALTGQRLAPSGLYLYSAELELINNKRVKVQGEINIIR